MAQKRMFSPNIVSSDAFLDMPTSSRELYFQLCMYADDDGFVNPKRVMRIIGASEDDLKVLIAKRFVIIFESGVIVVKHWLIQNLIRPDVYKETLYKKEKSLIGLNESGAYTELREGVFPLKQIEMPEWLKKRRGELRDGSGTVAGRSRDVRLGKVRLGKVRLEEATAENIKKQFFEHSLMEKIKQSFPNRNYELEFDLMIDWWKNRKNKLPKNISSFKNWLSNTKPSDKPRIIREAK